MEVDFCLIHIRRPHWAAPFSTELSHPPTELLPSRLRYFIVRPTIPLLYFSFSRRHWAKNIAMALFFNLARSLLRVEFCSVFSNFSYNCNCIYIAWHMYFRQIVEGILCSWVRILSWSTSKLPLLSLRPTPRKYFLWFYIDLLTPGSGSGDKIPAPGTGMNIPELIFENLFSVLGYEYLNSLMRIRIRDLVNPGPGSKINIPDPQPWEI